MLIHFQPHHAVIIGRVAIHLQDEYDDQMIIYMKLKTNKMYKISEDQLHELARLFMSQFLTLEPLSLDEFLSEYAEALKVKVRAYVTFLLEQER
jgi:hypothetical protein